MKKILISILTITMFFIMTSSTTVFADVDSDIISRLGLPYGVQTEPQQEKNLPSEIKEEILNKLLDSEYLNADSEDIVIRYYGTLSNGAMLINHYNSTYNYNNENPMFERISACEDTNYFAFSYYIPTVKDKVNLYMNGEFYTFKEAYESKLINTKILWEIEHSIDKLVWYKFTWCNEEPNVPTIINGDVDGDGELTVADVTLVQRKIAGITNFTETECSRADVNKDGQIDITDVTLMQKTTAKIN